MGILNKGEIHPSAIIGSDVKLGDRVTIGPNVIIYDKVEIEENSFIGANSSIGEPLGGCLEDNNSTEDIITKIGASSIIRSYAIIYKGVTTGEKFETGHRVTIRENTSFGINNRIGTLCDIQGDSSFGDYVRLHSNVHTGKKSRVADFVFIFPYVVLTNDPYPPSNQLYGVEIHNFAVIATSSVILPGVKVGSDALVGAMSLVKDDVPEGMVVVGNPAKVICNIKEIHNKLNKSKNVYPWRYFFDRGMPWEGIGYDKWRESLNGMEKQEN